MSAELPDDVLAALASLQAQHAAPQDPVAIVQQMLALAAEYKKVASDHEDLLLLERATSILQGLLAKDQQDRDGLIQGKASPRALRRTLGG
jgi:hypothetical protein